MAGEFDAVHTTRHLDVGEQQVDEGNFFEGVEGRFSVRRMVNLEAHAGELGNHHAAHLIVVFDKQDGLAVAWYVAVRVRVRLFFMDNFRRRGRKIQGHRRAASRLAADRHIAAGLIDEAEHHAEAQAAAFADFLGGEKRLENMIQNVSLHAASGIPHGQ